MLRLSHYFIHVDAFVLVHAQRIMCGMWMKLAGTQLIVGGTFVCKEHPNMQSVASTRGHEKILYFFIQIMLKTLRMSV